MLLVSLPGVAAGEPLRAYNQLPRLLKPGDMLTVTEWSGVKSSGRLAEITTCSLVLVTEDMRLEIPASRTKSIERIRRANSSQPQNRVADAGRNCNEPGCMAIRLALAGTTSINRAFQKIFNRREVIYKARARST